MPVIEWRDTYKVDVKIIDEQHMKLVELLNELILAKEESKDKEIHREVLIRLVDYTKYHFETEEKLMDTHRYPQEAIHKAQHKILINQIVELLKRYKLGQTNITDTIIEILNNWLFRHILKHDKDLGMHLKD